jgi:anti-anti-sigma factor
LRGKLAVARIAVLRPFQLTEHDLRPGCRDVQISGELDLAVAERLDGALERAIAEADVVLVGLESCEFIDSSGIAVVLRAQGRLAERGGRLAVYGPQDQVLRVLSMTGLTSNGLVFDSADEALAALS